MVLRAVTTCSYILVFNNLKNQRYCVLFYEIMGPPIWLNSSMMPHSLAFSSLGRFSVNDYNAKMKTRIAVTILLIAMVFVRK